MAVNMEEETLETLLNKATSPLNREEDWEYIMCFCDKVNQELEGAQTSTRLLAHKIQSPQEKEALQTLSVLEACVKNCGENFRKELGKYRFLNELIKVVSPKYLGTKTSDKVQNRVISLLYAWSIGLPDQVKIRDAYQMLKKQGIITTDPEYDSSLITEPPQPRQDRDTLFKDENKKQQLERLLKSSRPEDLQAANRLIKNVVQEDEAKMEKLRRRNQILEEVSNNIRLLNEMLTHFKPDESSVSDMQAMKELYDGCQKLRPSLFRLASDTDDDEQALMDILRANDDVSRVMQSFEKIVQPKLTSATDRKADGAAQPDGSNNENEKPSLVSDLAGLSLTPAVAPPTDDPFHQFVTFDSTNQRTDQDDNLLLNFQTNNSSASSFTLDQMMSSISSSTVMSSTAVPLVTSSTHVHIPKLPSPPEGKPQIFSDIDALSRGLMEESLGRKLEENFPSPTPKPTLNDLSKKPVNLLPDPNQTPLYAAQLPVPAPQSCEPELLTPQPPSTDLLRPQPPSTGPTSAAFVESVVTSPPDSSLSDVFVTLESIRPSTYTPLTVYDNNSIRVMMHFAKDPASPIRPDTLVAVISIMSTRTGSVKNVIFQAAAPKIMKVKLQPPSSTDLPPFNPIFTSPPITQVMIIANPTKKELKIRYKLDYKIDEETSISDSGMITGFPPCEQWGLL